MKKTRHLNKTITKILLYTTIIMLVLWSSINDYDISFIGIYLLGWCLIAFNAYILYKYGNRKVLIDKK